MSTPDSLHTAIANRFNLEELDLLCADLGITMEAIKGETLPAKALQLVGYCSRRDLVDKLMESLRKARPNVDWASYLALENRSAGSGLRVFFEHVAFYESGRLVFVNVSDAPITVTTVEISPRQGQVPQNAMFRLDGPEGAGTLPMRIEAGHFAMVNLSAVVTEIWLHQGSSVKLTVWDALGREYHEYDMREFNPKWGGYRPLRLIRGDESPDSGAGR